MTVITVRGCFKGICSKPVIDVSAPAFNGNTPLSLIIRAAPFTEFPDDIHNNEEYKREIWDNGCKVYPVRPPQCRSWPFWKENIRNHLRWQNLAESCPGVNTGKRHPLMKMGTDDAFAELEAIYDRLAEDCRSYTNCGRRPGKPWYYHENIGASENTIDLSSGPRSFATWNCF